MMTSNKLASVLLGCAVLLSGTGHDASAATRFPQITLYSGVGPINLEFVIKNSNNQVLCQKSGIKYTVSTPPIPCANLLNVKAPEKLKITIGPEANIKCAPASKPLEFLYQPGLDVSIIIKGAKNCIVGSK